MRHYVLWRGESGFLKLSLNIEALIIKIEHLGCTPIYQSSILFCYKVETMASLLDNI